MFFYTDKISIRLKNLDSLAFWKDKYPKGKVLLSFYINNFS